LPPHPQPHDYNSEIKTAWKKTPVGFSGDIAIPASFFEGRAFAKGYEVGINLGRQKAVRRAPSGKPHASRRIIDLSAKRDKLFSFEGDNPASYQRLVLTETE